MHFLTCIGWLLLQVRENSIRYCKKHTKPVPMLPCKVFDGVTVGYYCVFCYGFLPVDNAEVDLIKKFMVKQE